MDQRMGFRNIVAQDGLGKRKLVLSVVAAVQLASLRSLSISKQRGRLAASRGLLYGRSPLLLMKSGLLFVPLIWGLHQGQQGPDSPLLSLSWGPLPSRHLQREAGSGGR
jgi:hypothetical protein